MTTHYLKCWPEYFDAVERGEKTYECRRNDRGFQAGDTVVLMRTYDRMGQVEPAPVGSNRKAMYQMIFTIGYVLHGESFGLRDGWCIFSLLAKP